mmetsp:Transcript_99395/g.281331  ORF Transcript_99395/g.281331 Transcript_99395/m.281331 type:complete len:242 (-) Transcript_99395:474-1199(-)
MISRCVSGCFGGLNASFCKIWRIIAVVLVVTLSPISWLFGSESAIIFTFSWIPMIISSSTFLACRDSCNWMSMSKDFALPLRRRHALRNSSNCTSPFPSTSSRANTYVASSALTLIFFHSFAISGSSSFSSRSLVVMHPQLSSALHLWKRAMIWSVRKFSSSRSALWSAVWTNTPVTTFMSARSEKAMKAAKARPRNQSISFISGSPTSLQSTPPESACHSERIVWASELKCSLSLNSPEE